MTMGIFSGCGSSDGSSNNNTSENSQFFYDIQTALVQNEDDEPLEITDTVDDSTSFDTLL